VNALRSALVVIVSMYALDAKPIKIHGYITEIKSPTEFQIEDYRIYKDATLELEFEKDENDLKAVINFAPSDLRIGSELEIKGELNEKASFTPTP